MDKKRILEELIRTRRSVKPAQFGPGKVADEVVEAILESARWAPTHGMTQPWRFVVITGDGIERFTTFREEEYRRKNPGEQFNQLKFDKMRAASEKCSHIILIGMKRQESRKLPEWEEVAAVSSALQNMQLCATAYGVACYWSTGAMSTDPSMLSWLELGPDDLALGMLMLGQRGEEVAAPERHPQENFVRWQRK